MSKKIIAVFLAVVSILCVIPFGVFADDIVNEPSADEAIIIENINFAFATAAHGMNFGQVSKLLSSSSTNFAVEWKRIYEIKNEKDAKNKLYAGNEYDATIILKAIDGYTLSEGTGIGLSGATIVSDEFNEADGTVTVVFRFSASGNFYEKIITFFHNLFY